MTNLAAPIIALVVACGGVFLLVLFVRRLRLRLAMARWPRRRGVVCGRRVYSHANHSGAGYHRPVVTVEIAGPGPRWRVDCQSPTRLGFGSIEAAQSEMAAFPIGKAVEVYSDPRNPQRAFLVLPEISALLMLSLGSLFLLAFAVGVVNGLR